MLSALGVLVAPLILDVGPVGEVKSSRARRCDVFDVVSTGSRSRRDDVVVEIPGSGWRECWRAGSCLGHSHWAKSDEALILSATISRG